MKALYLIALALLDTPIASACQPYERVETAITPSGTVIVDGGGVLFQLTGEHVRAAVPPQTTLKSKEQPIAPGLFRRVYEPTKDRKLVIDPKHRYTQGGTGAVLAAPRLANLTSSLARDTGNKFVPDPGELVITLAEAPPSSAFILVIRTVDAGVAWMPLVKGQKTYKLAFGGKQCGGRMFATPVLQATRVTAVYLDRSGRESVATSPRAVAKP